MVTMFSTDTSLSFVGGTYADLLLLALVQLPIGYSIFLRPAVRAGALAFVSTHVKREGSWHRVVAFGATALIFNPTWPIYSRGKTLWAPLDIFGGLLLLATTVRAGGGQNKY